MLLSMTLCRSITSNPWQCSGPWWVRLISMTLCSSIMNCSHPWRHAGLGWVMLISMTLCRSSDEQYVHPWRYAGWNTMFISIMLCSAMMSHVYCTFRTVCKSVMSHAYIHEVMYCRSMLGYIDMHDVIQVYDVLCGGGQHRTPAGLWTYWAPLLQSHPSG
jgi:hypothetical protein